MQNKYHNQKVIFDGIKFDSKKEAKRYRELCLMKRAGVITDLELQKQYALIPAQKLNGKVVERAVVYKADFAYKEDGVQVVEDTKGVKTKDYIIKRKLMLWIYGIRIREV